MMRNQRGLSLIELSVVVVVLGLIGLVTWQFLAMKMRHQRHEHTVHILNAANQAIRGFVFLDHRLPCPDTNHDGRENCGSTEVAGFPWRTLGLPMRGVRRIRYGIYASSTSGGVKLDQTGDRSPLYMSEPGNDGVFAAQKSGVANGLDFCKALENIARSADPNAGLHDAATNQPLAYAIAWPGMTGAGIGRFDAGNAGQGPVFASPGKSRSPDYDDTVLAVSPDILWRDLHCGSNLAAADHALGNTEVAADLLLIAAEGEQKVLDVNKKLARADVSGAAAGILQATAGIASALADVFDNSSTAALANGVTGAFVAWAAAATAAQVASLVVAGVDQAYAVIARDGIDALYGDSQSYIDYAIRLQERLRSDALGQDKAGLGGVSP